jgi:hypothetical protein
MLLDRMSSNRIAIRVLRTIRVAISHYGVAGWSEESRSTGKIRSPDHAHRNKMNPRSPLAAG